MVVFMKISLLGPHTLLIKQWYFVENHQTLPEAVTQSELVHILKNNFVCLDIQCMCAF
jgi:hypothetical protein